MDKRKGLNITEFQPGQIITRLEAAIKYKEVPFLELVDGCPTQAIKKVVDVTDYSLRGKPVEFIAFENNIIYVKYLSDGCISEFLPEMGFDEGWGMFVDVLNKLQKDK